MKRIHLLRCAGPPEALEALFEAIGREGLRAGWLDLAAAVAPAELSAPGAAVGAGAFRAAAVAPGRVVTVKRVAGAPVLRDLLREHFLGCVLVVVREAGAGGAASALGADLAELPVLESGPGGFRVTAPGQAARELTAEALAARLRRPRPWG